MQSIASANALLSTCSAPHSSLSVWQISKAWWFHHKQHFPQHLPLMYQGLESGGKKKKRKEKTCKIIHIHSQKLADHRSDKRTSHSWQKVLKSERGHDVKRCPSCILKPLFFFFLLTGCFSFFISQGNIFNLACPACFPSGKKKKMFFRAYYKRWKRRNQWRLKWCRYEREIFLSLSCDAKWTVSFLFI